MPGPIRELLERDHVRLDDLLNQGDVAAPSIDLETYEAFRAGLLRHIAMEEKVLLPEARRLRGGESLAVAVSRRLEARPGRTGAGREARGPGRLGPSALRPSDVWLV